MKRHAKAPSAGSTSGIGSSRGLFGRAFAVRDASGDLDGSGALAPRLLPALIVTAVLSAMLTVGVATAAASPPGAFNDGASAGLSDTYTLDGRVDPEGLAVSDCHFSYGPTGEYGRTAPCSPSAAALGSGTDPVVVTGVTGALEPNTTYHFRLFASNADGAAQGKDRIFTTGPGPVDQCANSDIRAAQGIEVMRLPNCLALEQVSPSKKGNQAASMAGGMVSADGSRVLFSSTATIGECVNTDGFNGNVYIGALLPQSVWNVECTTTPVAVGVGTKGLSFNPGLSSWIQLLKSNGQDAYHRVTPGGLSSPLSPTLVNLTASGASPNLHGVSADHSHLYISPGPANLTGSYLPGDPVPAGAGIDANVYVSQLDAGGNPILHLLAKDRDGKVWGGNCGARLGGMQEFSLNLRNGNRAQGAISPDGSRVYFSTRAAQPAAGNCSEALHKKRILVREETPTGPKIDELFQSECDRVSPACVTTNGDDVYQGASVDQSRVYFTTTRQLADLDLDSSASPCAFNTAVSGCDLYLYDSNRAPGERLVDVSAGDTTAATRGVGAAVRNSLTAISTDGSHVYFVARTALTTDPSPTGAVAQGNANNLYLFTYPDEELSFIGPLATTDAGSLFGSANQANLENGAYPVPLNGTDGQGREIGGDGHVLVFASRTPLTPDDTDASTDIYRYDSAAETLLRVSKAVGGGSDNGAFNVVLPPGQRRGTDYAQVGRWVSESGSTVVFTTAEPLFPGDSNGAEDSYLWRDGQLYHLPGSTRSSLNADQITPKLSHDGSTVAYQSSQRLAVSDVDSTEDAYVLRPGGGIRMPVTATCEGEACQGAPATVSGEIGATTDVLAPPGNVKGQITCPKGKRKVRRGGKVRCVKPAKHRKNATKKKTGTKQGGQK